MDKIVIRPYAHDNKEDIIDLILNIQRNEFNVPITKEDQPDLNDISNFYQVGAGNFWVAIYNNEIVGTLSLLDIGSHQGALRKMFVKAAFRGSKYNIAKSLLQQLIIWSREHNIYNIYLGTTEKFLAAHRFYEKNGFVQIDKKGLPETFPIMKVDTRFYSLKVRN